MGTRRPRAHQTTWSVIQGRSQGTDQGLTGAMRRSGHKADADLNRHESSRAGVQHSILSKEI
jgi:hypothetical protein